MVKKKEGLDPKNKKSVEDMQGKVDFLLGNVSDIVTGSDYRRDAELSFLNTSINKLINSEMDLTGTASSEDLSSFINGIVNGGPSTKPSTLGAANNLDELFKGANNDLTNLLTDKNASDTDLFRDLRLVADHMYEMKEAVETTRDAIIGADANNEFGRAITFSACSDQEKETAYVDQIKAMEKEFRLLSKIKNHVVPKTLTYGAYHAYVAPYSELLNTIS